MEESTIISNWKFNKYDKGVFDEIRNILPESVYDAHAHIYRYTE